MREVFEHVPVDDDIQYVSRMVAVTKKGTGSVDIAVQITMDWRGINKFLMPVHHEVPSTEQLKYMLNGAKMFSELDINSAFYQIPLDAESRRLTTFHTPEGLMRCTRLVQGATPSSAICHEVVQRLLQGIQNQTNIADGILVWGTGETKEEVKQSHDLALR